MQFLIRNKLRKEVILSFFRKYWSCLSSSFGGRGAGFEVGKQEEGILNTLGGSAGRVKPPGNLIKGGFEGQSVPFTDEKFGRIHNRILTWRQHI